MIHSDDQIASVWNMNVRSSQASVSGTAFLIRVGRGLSSFFFNGAAGGYRFEGKGYQVLDTSDGASSSLKLKVSKLENGIDPSLEKAITVGALFEGIGTMTDQAASIAGTMIGSPRAC